MKIYKVVLCGDSYVGKTNYLGRLHSDEFAEDFVPTIGVEFLTKKLKINDEIVKAQVWDTAGQERYKSMLISYFRNAKGAFLLYDVSNRQSFQNASYWYEQVKAHAGSDLVVMLVGNKCDLKHQRQVSYQEAQEFAQENDMLFYETSAKTSENVFEAFYTTVQCIHQLTKDAKESDEETVKLEQETPESFCCQIN